MRFIKNLPTVFSILLFLFGSQEAFNQELATNPSSLKWSKMKSDHFKLIFPTGLDSVANKTINKLESNYLPVSHALNRPPRAISIILQNQNTESNGFVTITPRHSEFFITPPQDYTLLGTNNWLDLLATHEYRHVVQYDKALTGLTKVFYTLFGNYGLSGISHLAIPAWYWEGDAVGAETAHSSSGRGAIPSFSMLMRSQLVDYGKPFSYSKATGRSFKQHLPNHYILGYFLTNALKEKYGYKAWDQVLENTYKFPFYPFSFSNNLKKMIGKNIDNFYKTAYNSLQKDVELSIENRKLYNDNYLSISASSFYTDYRFPQVIADGKVLALKSGLSSISQFVILDKNNIEKKIHELGAYNDGLTLSVAQNKVVWAEFMPDPRWEMRNYSNLKILDITTGELTYLTQKARLAAPVLSPDGRQIVAVSTSLSGKYSLQIINANSGNMWKELPNPTGIFYVQPSWAADGKHIVVVALLNNKKAIQQINVETGVTSNILPFSNENYAHPVLKNNYLLYNNALNGIDNVFLFDADSGVNYQVTNAKFGAFNGVFSEDNKNIVFSDFTSLGHRIASIPFNIKRYIKSQVSETRPIKLLSSWMPEEARLRNDSLFLIKKYTSSKYSKWNILNANSWGFVANSTGSSLALGVDTQDILSTTTIGVGAGYNPNERQTNYFANISYQGFYPILDLNFSNEGRQTIIPKGSLKGQVVDSVDSWRQQSISFGLRLPFNFQRNKFYSKLTLGSQFTGIQGHGYELGNRYTTQIGGKSLASITNYLSYSRKKKNAKKDIGPRWEQNIFLFGRNTPGFSKLKSSMFAAQASFVIPGVGRHDNIRLRANYLTNGTKNNYFYSSPISFPRGYIYNIFDRMSTFSVDYRFPIADPDFAIGRLLYFQRIKGNFFADFGQGEYSDDKNIYKKLGYNSLGFDLSSIFNVMRFDTPIELGFRFNYIPRPQAGQRQFIITPLILDIPF